MKKIILMTCILLCVLLSFSGCSLLEDKKPASSAPESAAQESAPEADPTKAPQATPQPEVKTPAEFTMNHFALTEDAKAYLGDFGDEYQSFVNSILAYKDSFTFQDKDAKKTVLGVIGQFPLSSLCQPFDNDFDTLETAIAYKDKKDAFDQKVKAFEDAVSGIMAENNLEGFTEVEKALYLYQTVSSYSYSDAGASDCYSFITEKKGSSFGFSGALSYLLNQAGCTTQLATGTTDSNKDHRWVLFKANGQYYSMDPTFENGANGGKCLSYFAMSDEKREKDGCSVPYSTGENGYFKSDVNTCTDQQFDHIFADVSSFKLDQKEHILYLSKGGDEFTSTVKTDTFQTIN